MIPTPERPDNEEKLERLIDESLRQLPPRRAPRELEQRVLAELARRAAQPWWRKSFAHWPLTARAVLLVGCIGAAKLALMGAVWVMAGFDAADFRAAFAPQFSWMETGMTVVHAATGWIEIVARHIPSLWLYGGLGFFAAMYLALFGLGAAAYRTFHAAR